MDNKKVKKWLELLIYVLTAIAGFIGGQASAKNNFIDMFNKNVPQNEININK